MAPAHQRLGAADAAVAQIHLRLIQQLELALRIGFVQRLHQRQPQADVRAHLRLEEADGAAAVVLGTGQRQAGGREHVGAQFAGGGDHARADAGQHMVAAPGVLMRGRQH
ncbi:hypothetical protein D3C72_1638780 [compost metagenome]